MLVVCDLVRINIRWNLEPFFFPDRFQFVDILWMSCINADFQLLQQAFDVIKVWWLRRTFQKDNLCLLPCAYRVVVMLKPPSPFKSKISYIFFQVFLENLIIIFLSYTIPHCRNKVSRMLASHFFYPNILHIILAEQFYLRFIWPQNLFPKYVVFTHMFHCKLQSSF